MAQDIKTVKNLISPDTLHTSWYCRDTLDYDTKMLQKCDEQNCGEQKTKVGHRWFK